MWARTDGAVESQICSIGVDIGRTKIAVGVVTAAGRIAAKRVVGAPPHTDQVAVVAQVSAVVKELANAYPAVRQVGVGTPEVVEWPSGCVIDAGGSGQTFALRSMLEEAVSLPTVVDSDANVAAWAEFRIGPAVDVRNAVIVTVGTGIGGGIILDGQLYRGSAGFAGEIGHIVVQPSGEECQCGNRGCLEALASGTALSRDGRRAAERDPNGAIARLARRGGTLTGHTVFEAARHGDVEAIGLFAELGRWLGLGLAAVILLYDPEIIVLSGGLAGTGDLLLAPTRESIQANCVVRGGRVPTLALARSPEWSGVVGSGLLAFDTFAAVREVNGLDVHRSW